MKKLIIAGTFAATLLMTFAFTAHKNTGVVILVSIEVKNFQEWKKAFDSGAAIREKNGIKVLTVCKATDNENKVTVIEEAGNLKIATDFLELLKTKQKSGDISKMEVTILDKVE